MQDQENFVVEGLFYARDIQVGETYKTYAEKYLKGELLAEINNYISNLNMEISKLRASLLNAELEKTKAEVSRSDSAILKATIDLRATTEKLEDAIYEVEKLRGTKSNGNIDNKTLEEMNSKIDKMSNIDKIREEFESVKDEVSELKKSVKDYGSSVDKQFKEILDATKEAGKQSDAISNNVVEEQATSFNYNGNVENTSRDENVVPNSFENDIPQVEATSNVVETTPVNEIENVVNKEEEKQEVINEDKDNDVSNNIEEAPSIEAVPIINAINTDNSVEAVAPVSDVINGGVVDGVETIKAGEDTIDSVASQVIGQENVDTLSQTDIISAVNSLPEVETINNDNNISNNVNEEVGTLSEEAKIVSLTATGTKVTRSFITGLSSGIFNENNLKTLNVNITHFPSDLEEKFNNAFVLNQGVSRKAA